MKIPYKTEPKNFVTMDHEQLITADPDHVCDLIVAMSMKSDTDLAMADVMIGRIRNDKKKIEDAYKEPVERAHKAHKKLTTVRNDILKHYVWA